MAGVSRSDAESDRPPEPDGHDVPARFDAGFVFRCGPARLARLAAPRSAEPWLVAFAAWLRSRGTVAEASASRGESPAVEGFPAGSLPILTVRNGAGELALVRSIGRGSPLAGEPEPVTAGDGEFNAATAGAMRAVRSTARRYLPEVRMPQLRFEHEAAVRLGGPSAALPTAMLVWSELLGLRLPDDLVATGGHRTNGKHRGLGEFVPVDPALLPAKFAAARAWGYRRILLVEGQEVPAACGDPSTALEIHRVPGDPARLLAFLLPLIEGSVRGDRAATRAATLALLSVDLATDDRAGLAAIEPVVQPFLGEGTPANLRLLAHDLLSRHLLHAGDTDASRHHHEIAESLVGVDDRPEGLLGDLFAYERVAHAQMLAIDRGEFLAGTPEALRLDACLAELEGKWRTRHERLMRIFLRNTRSWRRNFAGRFGRDANLLRQAWDDRAALHAEWPDLFDGLARDLGRADTTVRRAESELLDVATALVSLGEGLPPGGEALLRSFSAGLGPAPVPRPDDPFGPVTWLRRRIALGEPIHAADLATVAAGLIDESRPLPHQHVRAAELVLARAPAGAAWAVRLAETVAGSTVFREDLADPDSILRVLSARASAALRPFLGDATPAPLSPRDGTPLRRLFDDLAADPATVAVRCPY
jgi:hypothetical protein